MGGTAVEALLLLLLLLPLLLPRTPSLALFGCCFLA